MGTLSKNLVGNFINKHFIATFEQVGTFQVNSQLDYSQFHRGQQRLLKQGGNVVTYFCTPAGNVLHMCVGNTKADRLSSQARWAVELHEKLAGHTESKQRAIVRSAHAERFATLHKADGNDPRASALGRAKYPKDTSQLLASTPPKVDHRGKPVYDVPAAMKYVGVVRNKDIHFLLAESPLVPLAILEKPAFQHLARQPFRRRGVDSDSALATVRENYKQKRPTLVVISNPGDRRHNQHSPQLEALLKHSEMTKLSGVCGFLELSKLELTTLADDLNLPPPLSDGGARFRYVMIGGDEQQSYWLGEGTRRSEVIDMLRQVAARKRPHRSTHDGEALTKFVAACNLVQDDPARAQRNFQEIVDRYPHTLSAQNAKAMLSKLK